ncbi:MAG TPA: hypothetical protein PK967_17320, partial [Candidatus Hydrogenedentes bacterium]|nr:hypothetical protein [Candidatus Hydrogenedentota bacterium]
MFPKHRPAILHVDMGFGLKDQHIVTRHCPAIPGIDADFGLKGQHIKALGRERILPSPALKGRDI